MNHPLDKTLCASPQARQRALDVVRGHIVRGEDDLTAASLGRELGVQGNAVHRSLRRLEQEGKLRRFCYRLLARHGWEHAPEGALRDCSDRFGYRNKRRLLLPLTEESLCKGKAVGMHWGKHFTGKLWYDPRSARFYDALYRQQRYVITAWSEDLCHLIALVNDAFGWE